MAIGENAEEIYSNSLNSNGLSKKPPPSSKFRWGELDEEDGEDLDFLLPPPKVIGPDEQGVKKIVEYKFNEEGQKVKVITTTRSRKLAKTRLNKRAIERRDWKKFGDAVNEDIGSRLTMVSTEEILLERPRAPGAVGYFPDFFTRMELCRWVRAIALHDLGYRTGKEEVWGFDISFTRGFLGIVGVAELLSGICGAKAEDSKAAGDPLASLGKGGAVLMVCRTCGKKGDHWTSKCPYKDLAAAPDSLMDKVPTADGAVPSSGKGTYVPPSLRGGGERPGTEMRRRNEENSVRVTNLSEDTREVDLHELFQTFGSVTRVYVAVDQKTGMSRGFGFVNFVNREDAQRAINKLNGYGYDNLILRVEWATPRQT
eukprot:Gb_40499 [translate_table: standard]